MAYGQIKHLQMFKVFSPNDDYLFLINKRENKNYNYNIKDTPLGVMLDKENIIEKLSKVEKFNKIDKNLSSNLHFAYKIRSPKLIFKS